MYSDLPNPKPQNPPDHNRSEPLREQRGFDGLGIKGTRKVDHWIESTPRSDPTFYGSSVQGGGR